MRSSSVRFCVACVASTLSFLLALAACKKDERETAAGGGGELAASSPPSAATPPPQANTVAGDAFEGVIQVSITSSRKPTPETLAFETKGDKTRMDLPADRTHNEGAGYMVFDAVQKKAVVVMDEKKMAMTLDTSKFAARVDAKAGPPPKITKTGKIETVAGHPCELWEIEKTTGKASACMAKNIPFFMTNMGGRGGAPGWVDDVVDQKMFPLRMIERDAAGAETSRFEATKIERRAISDARFSIPAGYQTMDMSAMMQGLGLPGGPGGPPGMPSSFALPNGVKHLPGAKMPPGPPQH